MKKLILVSIAFLTSAMISDAADAGNAAYVQEATVCPAAAGPVPPTFSAQECEQLPYWQIDPQGLEIWVRAVVDVSDALVSSDRPLGLFVSAKASSEAYLNGVRLGANGTPAASRNEEAPGRMDAVFYAPRETVRAGENEIILRMSSQHGFLTFRYPVHWIAIADYGSPTAFLLNEYWPSLIPFGALILGAIYFITMAATDKRRLNTTLLILVSLFAAAQLFVEIYRGLSPYLYPVHEWRMILIVLFSLGFALCLLAYVFTKFLRTPWLFAFASGITIAPIVLAPGYDGKAGFTVFSAALIGAIVSGYATFRKMPQARLHFAVLALFAASILIFEAQFLNVIFFYEVTALLLTLFVAQAMTASKERKLLEDERARSRQLELSLERANQSHSDQHITVASAGKLEIIRIEDIAHCKGAGDYVEITLYDGRELLYGGSLSQLEQELPPTFLRVHRSYLVNTNFVQSLKRENNGVGRLILNNGGEVPVSRRIMPKVRSAFQ